MKTARWLGFSGFMAGVGYWLFRYFRPQHSVLVLDDKVVIITGASSGIGRELALAFAQRGAKMVLAARRIEKLEAVRREIEPYAAEVLIVPTDVADEGQIKHLVETTLDTFGRIDVLVNNAGITHNGFLHEQDPARIREMVDVNLTGAMCLTQQVLPHMLLQRQGYIVNIGSIASRLAAPLFSSYTATKFGLAGFTDSLRRELKGTGIRLLLVMPGWTRTEMLREEWETGQNYLQLPIQDADHVANVIVEALVIGSREIIFGGEVALLAVMAERYLPRAVNLYWRYMLGRQWVSVAKRIDSKQ